MTINGNEHSSEVEPRTLLVHHIRENIGLTGTNIGCDTSSCGACTVHIDGQSVKSCTMLAVQADGADITTIEGMAAADGTLHPMQQAFMENHGLQCGYCTPGMVMAATSFLDENPSPERSRGSGRPGRKSLPLHRLSQHREVSIGLRFSRGINMSVIGTRMLRKEDPALLTGENEFVDDIQIDGQLWMGMVRSTVAHATITSVDTSAALDQPGVVAAYTGADLAEGYWIAPMPCAWPVTPEMHNPPHYPVAVGSARYVGDIVAVVLADSRTAAADAVEHVVVQYDALPIVASITEASTDAALVHPDLGTNKAYTWAIDADPDGVQAALDSARVQRQRELEQQRLIPNAMEPRGVLAIPSPHAGDLTLYSSTQIPHILKVMIAATTGIPEHSVRIIAPAVGGGFGAKLNVYADEILAATLATKLGRPVRWTETRTEAAGSTTHGRGQLQHIELGADSEGKLTAVRVKIDADMGAYMQLITPGVALLGSFLYHGVYETPAFSFTCEGYFTNMMPTDAYRGAGRPEASYAIERAMDMLAAEVGVGPEEIRRRNFVNGGDKFENWDSPGRIGVRLRPLRPALDAALEAVGYDDLRAEQARRREAGETKQLGIGMCTYVELCGLAPSRALGGLGFGSGGWEHATVRMLPTGMIEVVSGSTPTARVTRRRGR